MGSEASDMTDENRGLVERLVIPLNVAHLR